MRLNGALVHIYEASPRASERRRRRFRVGKLAIPPDMLNRKKHSQKRCTIQERISRLAKALKWKIYHFLDFLRKRRRWAVKTASGLDPPTF